MFFFHAVPSPKALCLPTIQSFGEHVVAVASATGNTTKKIRWADEIGQDLTKVKLIESWRDMVQHVEPSHDVSTMLIECC